MSKTPFELYHQFNIAIIEDAIANCIDNFKKLLKDDEITITTSDTVEFTNVCETKDLDYDPPQLRFILYEPLSNINTTVFFTNLVDGWYTGLYNYSRLFDCNVFFPGFTVSLGRSQPAYFFRHFKNIDGEIEERVVYVMKEDRWIFFETSSPLEIEDTRNYLRKRKTDRLNNDIIIEYLKEAGYDLTDKAFYKTNKDSTLITWNRF